MSFQVQVVRVLSLSQSLVVVSLSSHWYHCSIKNKLGLTSISISLIAIDLLALGPGRNTGWQASSVFPRQSDQSWKYPLQIWLGLLSWSWFPWRTHGSWSRQSRSCRASGPPWDWDSQLRPALRGILRLSYNLKKSNQNWGDTKITILNIKWQNFLAHHFSTFCDLLKSWRKYCQALVQVQAPVPTDSEFNKSPRKKEKRRIWTKGWH